MATEQELIEELLKLSEEMGGAAVSMQQILDVEQQVQARLAHLGNQRRLPDLVAYQRDREMRAARPAKLLSKLWEYQTDVFLDLRDRCEKLSGIVLAFIYDVQIDIHAPRYYEEIVELVQERAYNPEALIKLMHSPDYGYFFLKRLQYAIEDAIVVDDESFYWWAKKARVPFHPRNPRHWKRLIERIQDHLQELPPVTRVGQVNNIEHDALIPGFSYNPLEEVYAQLQAQQEVQ